MRRYGDCRAPAKSFASALSLGTGTYSFFILLGTPVGTRSRRPELITPQKRSKKEKETLHETTRCDMLAGS